MGRRTINLTIFIFFVLAAIPLVWSLFAPGYFQTHDGDYFIIRLIEFDKVFKAGQIPPRWAPDLNYGYGLPVFNFFYPGYLYLGEILRFFNFSYTDSLKFLFIISFPLSAFGMYLFANKIFGRLPGIVSGLFYLFAPYRLLDVYVRGQIGEIMALTIIPYIFWIIVSISDKNHRRFLILDSLLLGLFLISHNIMVMIFMVVLLSYLLFLLFHQKFRIFLRQYWLLFLLGFCFSAFFVLPAIFEKQNVILGQQIAVNYQDHFPAAWQLVYSPWGYGYSEKGISDGMSFQIGVAHLAVFLLILFSLGAWILRLKKNISFEYRNIIFFFGTAVISIFLTLEISKPIWEVVPYLPQVQFPWRLNALTVFSLSIAAGGLMRFKFKYLLPVLLIVLFINVRNYCRPGYFERYNDKDYLNNYSLYRGSSSIADEFFPIWVEKKPGIVPEQKINTISGQAAVLDYKDKTVSQEEKIEVKTEKALIEVNTTYYPGWKILVNNRQVPISIGKPYGTILFEVPQGIQEIHVFFQETSLRSLSNFLFLAGILLSVVALIVLK